MNTRLLIIRLIMMTLALFVLIYVIGAIVASGHYDLLLPVFALIVLTAPLFGWTLAGWAGLASYNLSQKEARRGELDHHRP